MKSDWVRALVVRQDGVVFQSWLNSAMIEKMFEGPETFVISNDSIKRCYIHSENKFALAEETKVTKNFKCVLDVLNVRR